MMNNYQFARPTGPEIVAGLPELCGNMLAVCPDPMYIADTIPPATITIRYTAAYFDNLREAMEALGWVYVGMVP